MTQPPPTRSRDLSHLTNPILQVGKLSPVPHIQSCLSVQSLTTTEAGLQALGPEAAAAHGGGPQGAPTLGLQHRLRLGLGLRLQVQLGLWLCCGRQTGDGPLVLSARQGASQEG